MTYNYSSDQNKCSRINGADAIFQLRSRERSSRVAEFMRKKSRNRQGEREQQVTYKK